MPVEVEVEGLAEAIDRFAQGDERIGKALRRATERSVQLVRRRMAAYPRPSRGRMRFKSDKQRRFFFAALREGLIQVPYRRSGTLGRRWTSKVSFAGDVVAFVGNSTLYVRQVQSFEDQAYIHKGNWQTEKDIAAESQSEIMSFYAEEISALL